MSISAEVISSDVACIECRYNLRGLSGKGRCPECGVWIEVSLAALSKVMHYIPRREWKWAVRAVGCWCISFCMASLTFPILYVSIGLIPFHGKSTNEELFIRLGYGWVVAGLLFWNVGLVCMPQPNFLTPERWGPWNGVVWANRAMGWAAFLGLMCVIFFLDPLFTTAGKGGDEPMATMSAIVSIVAVAVSLLLTCSWLTTMAGKWCSLMFRGQTWWATTGMSSSLVLIGFTLLSIFLPMNRGIPPFFIFPLAMVVVLSIPVFFLWVTILLTIYWRIFARHLAE